MKTVEELLPHWSPLPWVHILMPTPHPTCAPRPAEHCARACHLQSLWPLGVLGKLVTKCLPGSSPEQPRENAPKTSAALCFFGGPSAHNLVTQIIDGKLRTFQLLLSGAEQRLGSGQGPQSRPPPSLALHPASALGPAPPLPRGQCGSACLTPLLSTTHTPSS